MKRVFFAVGLMLSLLTVAATAQFTEWSAPVNVGPPVSSALNESCMEISKNGLSLYFARYTTSWDLYVSQRASVDEPWGPPLLLPNINTTASETCPALSLDEHRFYFSSNRDGGCGGSDLYVSRRQDRRDDFGWEPPVNLGCEYDGFVNTASGETTPEFFEDETGAVVMYFGGTGVIRASRMTDDDTFGPAAVVTELGASAGCPAVRRDGLEITFCSSRSGGLGGSDMWMATRESTRDQWSTPANLTVLNTAYSDNGRLGLSFDGRTLYFTSNRPGTLGLGDVYVTTREKLRGKK